MEETTEKKQGFKRGLDWAYNNISAALYSRLLKDVSDVCTSTETRGNSRSSYYNKMYGRTPLTVSETERLSEVFAKYHVTDWQGVK